METIEIACKLYFKKADVCMNGFPLVPSHSRFSCVEYPGKCPVSLWERYDTALTNNAVSTSDQKEPEYAGTTGEHDYDLVT